MQPSKRTQFHIPFKIVVNFLLFAALFTVFGGGIASAHSLKTADKVSTFVQYTTVPMYVDCSKGSAAVKALEIKDHDCSAHTTNTVGPYNEVDGTCGSAFIFGKGIGFGFSEFSVGGSSKLGGILNVSYTINYLGGLLGQGTSPSTVFPGGSTNWSDKQDILTGSGRITGVLIGADLLENGKVCTTGPNPNTNFNA